MTESLTGQLLVASSLVTQPISAGGVCLVVHQDDENVIGVMLNRPMKPNPAELLALLQQNGEDLPEPSASDGEIAARFPNDMDTSSSADSPLGLLHFGGPMSGPVVALHQDQQQAEAETGEGIYVAAQKHHLENLVREKHATFRLFVGHLGWKHEQLEHEIAAGVWHQVPATRQTVFSPYQDMWPRVIRRATSNSMAKWLGIPDVIGAGELN